MYVHNDTDMATVVTTTVKAIMEGARRLGKAERGITAEQIGQLQTAIRELQRVIETKRPPTN